MRPDAAGTRAPSISSPSVMLLPLFVAYTLFNLLRDRSIRGVVTSAPDPLPGRRQTDASDACRAALEPDALLDALVEQEAVGITIVDRDLRVVRANRAFGIFGDEGPVPGRRPPDRRGAAPARIADRARDDGRAADRHPLVGPRGRRRRPGRSRELPLVPGVPLAGRLPRGRGRGRHLDHHRDHRPQARAARARRRRRASARERCRRARGARALPDHLRLRLHGHPARASLGPPRRGEPGDRGDARVHDGRADGDGVPRVHAPGRRRAEPRALPRDHGRHARRLPVREALLPQGRIADLDPPDVGGRGR